jgi:hypothetical protein
MVTTSAFCYVREKSCAGCCSITNIDFSYVAGLSDNAASNNNALFIFDQKEYKERSHSNPSTSNAHVKLLYLGICIHWMIDKDHMWLEAGKRPFMHA